MSQDTSWKTRLVKYQTLRERLFLNMEQIGLTEIEVRIFEEAVVKCHDSEFSDDSPESYLEAAREAALSLDLPLQDSRLVYPLMLYFEITQRICEAEQEVAEGVKRAEVSAQRASSIEKRLKVIDSILDEYAEERGAKPIRRKDDLKKVTEDE